jgi:RNA polymerase sigma-32 factor
VPAKRSKSPRRKARPSRTGKGAPEPSRASETATQETEEPEEVLEPEVTLVEDEAGVPFDSGEAAETVDVADTRALVPTGPRDLARADPLTRYISEVARYPELSREEEVDLARRYRETGDPDAALRLVTANLQLVVKIALMFRRAIRNMLDLIQEGNVGLIEALRRFDPDQKVRFSTYASWWIKAYILKFLLDNSRLVRVGTTNARRKLIYNLRREQQALEARGIRPTPKLLADHFGVSQEDVIDVQRALEGGDLPIDAPVREGSRETFSDFLPAREDAEASVVDQQMRARLDAHLEDFRRELNERERLILDRRLLADEPATLQDLGDHFGVTREAIRQSEARLTGRLREYLSRVLAPEEIRHFTGGDSESPSGSRA